MIDIVTYAKSKEPGKGSSYVGSPSYSSSIARSAIADLARNLTDDSTDWTKISRMISTAIGTLDSKFLSKVHDDIAAGSITFQQGLESVLLAYLSGGATFGTFVASQSGGKIDSTGNGELESLKARTDIEIGEFASDSTGGRAWVDENEASHVEIDYLTVRRAAMFREITIKELKHIGGELALTPAAEKCSHVEYITSGGSVTTDYTQAAKFRCYFPASDNDGNAITNDFIVNDQVRCQKFDLQDAGNGYVSTKYYWRLVTGVGTSGDYHYIDLSNVSGQYDAASGLAGVPSGGDNMVQLGCRNSSYPNRQSAIILSAVSEDAPSTKYYQGIDSFALTELVKDEGYDSATGKFHVNVYGISYTGDSGGNPQNYMRYTPEAGVEISGKLTVKEGSTLADGRNINNLGVTEGNLLRNSGFTGNFIGEDLTNGFVLDGDSAMYSDTTKYWTTDVAAAVEYADSMSGMALVLSSQSLSQQIEEGLVSEKEYILSFKATGSSLTFSIGGTTETVTLDGTYKRYDFPFICSDATADTLSITNATCTISELSLMVGNIPIEWNPSHKDDKRALADFYSQRYVSDAVRMASTTINGGLVLTQMIKVGAYRNQQMIEETGGMSGAVASIDENDPFVWGGGDLSAAINAVNLYRQDPNYEPTAAELAACANFVVTHGGRAILHDIILRGYIHALGGVFKSITSPNGNFNIDEDGNMSVHDATISGNMYTPMFTLNQSNIDEYTTISPTTGRRVVDLEKTGLNICVENLHLTRIELPISNEYQGAVFRIFNNTDEYISITNTVISRRTVSGTYINTSTSEDIFAGVYPYCYLELLCQQFNSGSFTSDSFDDVYKTIDASSSFTEVASGLQVGDILHIAAGVIRGSGGYQVKGGTSASSLTKTFADTTSATTVFYKTLGYESDYIVVSSPSCPKIFAKVDDGQMVVSVEKRNTEQSYRWMVVSETEYKQDTPDVPYKMSFFHVSRGGHDVGYEPYITGDGIIKFRHWERQDDDGVVHYDD